MIARLVACTAALLLSIAGASAQNIEISLGHAHTEQGSYHKIALKFQEELAKSGINVTIFPNATLGGELRMLQGVRTGSVDAIMVSQPSLENIIPEYRVLSLPYLFEDQDHLNAVLHGAPGRKLLDVLQNYGMVGFDWGSVYERNIAGSKAVKSIDDMAGLKIRVVQSPGFVKAYEALGAQPTAMAYSELFLALQNGVVDAAELATGQIISDGFAEVVSNYSYTRVNYIPTLMVMSANKFNSYPKAVQDKISAAAEVAMKYGYDYVLNEDAEAVKALEARGVQFWHPDLKPFIEKARSAWGDILGDTADNPDVKAFLAEAEKLRRT